MTWNEGLNFCKSKGLKMATFDTYNEAVNFKNAMVSKSLYPWVGINDQAKEGDYKTVDGTKSVNIPWIQGEPNNFGGLQNHNDEDCVHLKNSDGFNDLSCTLSNKVACMN
jgi:hypothetical protein